VEYEDVINQVLLKIERLEALNLGIESIREQLKKLPGLEQEAREAASDVTRLLDSLDVTARHNHGWERRIVPFLMRMHRAMTARQNIPATSETARG